MQKQIIVSLVFGVFILTFAIGFYAYAVFDPPTAFPPADNVFPPLNTGAIDQSKEGDLTISRFNAGSGLWEGLLSADLLDIRGGGLFNTGGSTNGLIVLNGNVGIGIASPQGALDVVSTTGGFIVPRMTTIQRDALTPVNGMIIYNITMNQFNFYEFGSWVTK